MNKNDLSMEEKNFLEELKKSEMQFSTKELNFLIKHSYDFRMMKVILDAMINNVNYTLIEKIYSGKKYSEEQLQIIRKKILDEKTTLVELLELVETFKK